MNTYDNYKKSNSPWIREIPSHWNIKKIKHLLKEEKDALKTGPFGSQLKSSDLSLSGTYKVYTQRNILDKDAKTGTDYIDYDKFQDLISFKVYSKDILFTTRGTIGKCYQLPMSIEEGVLHPCVIRIQINEELLLYKWLEYYVNDTNCFISNVKSESNSTIIDVIYGGTLKEIKVPIPPLPEQKTIATYLDHKTAEIDDLIQTKKALIQKYQEHKNAIINQAVTKGINDAVEMKGSGIEWLGDIPKHWEVKKLKYVIDERLKYGANEAAVLANINEPRYIRITDFGNDGNLRKDTFKSLPMEKASDYLLCEGDILFARSGATVGKTFQFKNYKGKACFAGYLIKASPNENIILSDFLYLFTKSSFYERWKESIFNKATIQNIGADKYAILDIPFSSIEEQEVIVKHIKTKTTLLNQKIAIATEAVTLLEEYRTALISDVVTGKIKIA